MSDKTQYDAIVIGAGLAGLSCAAHLAKAGKKVVILEQQSRPGGYWTSFSRKGLIFDISTHWVTEPHSINRILQDLGGPTVEFVQLEHLGRYMGPPVSRGRAGLPGTPPRPDAAAATPAWDILVGPDAEAFKKSVRDSFPSVSDTALDTLIKTAMRVSRVLDSLPVYSRELASPLTRLKNLLEALPHMPRLIRLGRIPAAKYFEGLFPGADLAGLRAALVTLAPIPGVPAVAPLVMLGTGLRGRLYSPRDGAQVLGEAFGEAATRDGVEIRYRTRVTAILTSGRKVSGVLLDDRSELHAPAVVSAVDARQTFYRLLHRDRVPGSYRKALDTTPVSQSYGIVSAVTTLDPTILGFDGTDVFVSPTTDASRGLESTDPADCFFLMAFPQYYEPNADRSLRAVQIVAPSSYDWHEHWDTSPTPERGEAYRALKEQWGRTIVDRAQEYLPRLSSHLELADVATPITMYRYTLNTEGAPVGWHYSSRRRWKQRVPFLKGLYQAGHWVGPSGALWVTRSGKWAAELVVRDNR
jgi:phytoene dehydrogenase-like protein